MLIAEIAQYLQSKGLGVFDPDGVSGNIYLEYCPDSPDAVIYITASGGPAPDAKHPIDKPTVQMIIRGGLNPAEAQQKAQDIYNALHAFHHKQFVSDGRWIVGCWAMQGGPVHMGVDDLRRHEYSLNFQLEIVNNTVNRNW